MNVWLFPETDNVTLNTLWAQQIHPLFADVFRQKEVVDSHRPPTQDDIETFLAKSDDPRIIKAMARLAQMESEVATQRHALNEMALEELHSPANADEKKAARTAFNQLKNRLITGLHSLGHVAAHDGEQAVVEWIETALTQIPKLNTTSNNHDLKAMREWLKARYPDEIKSRGTIPLKYKQIYYNRSE